MSIVDPATVPGPASPQPASQRASHSTTRPAAPWAGRSLLARDHRRTDPAILRCAPVDRPGRGAVAVRGQGGAVRRLEPGPRGPLVLEAWPHDRGVGLAVWGDPATQRDVVEQALADCAAWVGLDDDEGGFRDVIAGHPLLRRLRRELGPVRLPRLPRLGEALGRSILGQLVQAAEGRRSTAEVAALAGSAGAHGLWSWPTPAQVGATPAWALRRCGVSLRGAQALHAGAVADGRLRQAGRDWALLDRRLRALPGVGVWTSAEVRLAFGDADAVSVGDYNLPTLVGHVLAGADRRDCDDALMLELVGPFEPHRGRVIRLVELAAARRLVSRPGRRAPRAAWSRHRYW